MRIFNVIKVNKIFETVVYRTGLSLSQATKITKRLNLEEGDSYQNEYKVEEEFN